MKQHVFTATLLILTVISSCGTKTEQGIFYDDGNNNRAHEMQSHNHHLYILGQHIFKEAGTERNTSLLCIDTFFNKQWDAHFGNQQTGERYEHFVIDSKGNFYLTGHTSSMKTALLLKLNAAGQPVWRKEFPGIRSLNQIRLINDTAIIMAGIRRFSETEITGDSAFVQKTDSGGHIAWRTPVCKDIGLRFLGLYNNQIIYCGNAGADDYNGGQDSLNSRLLLLDGNGHIEKHIALTVANTGINLGVKAIAMRTDNKQRINILVQSHNSMNPKMAVVQFDAAGNRMALIEHDAQKTKLKVTTGDNIFFNPALNLSQGGKKTAAIVVKENSAGDYYFTLIDTDNKTSFVGSTQSGNSTYTVSNFPGKKDYTSMWKVAKLN